MSSGDTELIITTSAGKLRGRIVEGIGTFLGIPYAAPPIGAAAYAAPQPVPPWSGIRDALANAPTPAQVPYPPPFAALLDNPIELGDDVLAVNVWTPDPSVQAKLPVLVWIPGGAFTRGSNAVPGYHGGAFARDGVVTVTINYRLGAPGFAVLPDAPANRGLLDQIAALQWVRDNIAAFGGDPDRVTIAGESAGAISVLSLLTSPAAAGRFTRAIAQSGTGRAAATADDLVRPTRYLAEQLGVTPTAAGLAEVAPGRLLEAQTGLVDAMRLRPDPAQWGQTTIGRGGGMMPFFPVLDDQVLPAVPEEALAAGTAAQIDLLIGTTKDEFRFFVVPPGLHKLVTPEGLAGLAAAHGWPPELVTQYVANRPGETPGDVYAALATDWLFRVPSLRAAQAHAGRSLVYQFDWPSPQDDLRAAHALEIGFVFDTLDLRTSDAFTGPEPPQPLADTMHAAWVAFASGGDPGWPVYTAADRSVRVFDHPDVGVAADPGGAERALWDGVI